MAIQENRGKAVTLRFNTRLCIHAGACVAGAPAAFDPSRKDWIDADAADADTLVRVVEACPSGALTIERHDGGAGEAVPAVNRVTLRENGPLELRGEIEVPGEAPMTRASLCRCGLSKRKPFCDNSHQGAFEATGDALAQETTLDTPDLTGPLTVTLHENGPLQIKGPLEVAGESGAMITRVKGAFFCRCGQSANKPFCDGSHKAAGFAAEG